MKYLGIAMASALLLAGCTKNIENKEAVQTAVSKYVATKGINTDQMDVKVTSVTFHGNQADASVAFAPKGSTVDNGVSAAYKLERVKDEWQVKSRSAMQTMHAEPAPGAGTPGTGMPSGTLPPGHPGTGSATGTPTPRP